MCVFNMWTFNFHVSFWGHFDETNIQSRETKLVRELMRTRLFQSKSACTLALSRKPCTTVLNMVDKGVVGEGFTQTKKTRWEREAKRERDRKRNGPLWKKLDPLTERNGPFWKKLDPPTRYNIKLFYTATLVQTQAYKKGHPLLDHSIPMLQSLRFFNRL